MNKIIKKITIPFIAIILILITKTNALGGFSISSSKSSINEGESVTLSIKGNNAYGKVNITATNAKVDPSSVFLQNNTKTVTITSTSSKDISVSVSPASSGLGDIDEKPITETQSITIKVNGSSDSGKNNSNSNGGDTTTTKSNVATLSNLGIKPNDFSGFRSNTYSYNAEVPNETEKIEIYASKGQSGQKISGTGTKTLKEGVNTFNIVVTAEDGKTQKTYTINVTRKTKDDQSQETNEQTEENTEENTEEQPEEVVFGLSELKIEGYELEPQFQTDVYEYRIDLKEDLEKLDITTLATEANSNIEIVGNENFEDGENIITIVVKGENEEKVATYQIVVNKNIENKDDAINLEQDHQQMIKKIIAISIAGGLVLILVIAFIVVKVKKMKEPKQGYIPYENTFGDYKEDEIEEQSEELNDEVYEEKTRKKKHSKGKRFK